MCVDRLALMLQSEQQPTCPQITVLLGVFRRESLECTSPLARLIHLSPELIGCRAVAAVRHLHHRSVVL